MRRKKQPTKEKRKKTKKLCENYYQSFRCIMYTVLYVDANDIPILYSDVWWWLFFMHLFLSNNSNSKQSPFTIQCNVCTYKMENDFCEKAFVLRVCVCAYSL